ncbi:DUF1272 domain-containing protein [Aestuariivirga litoralis]|uniref:DUF1272 domain-containing protein n=1 Tax=Aestuariivirga litoralis TaxID=2650924 RepID=UPI0018C5CE69|nr:DUF1272 domain-containing protein [Aestuariivirga litoralis]MBG1233296.1 DUF1272 domain-containing protein [Aestuariivirga litoralis]
MPRLELRPNCELCDKDLPPQSEDARICTYECTYCADCAEKVLHNVCINCGGNLVVRPMRPVKSWHPEANLGLIHHPASDKRVHTSFSNDEIAAFVARVRDLAPGQR